MCQMPEKQNDKRKIREKRRWKKYLARILSFLIILILFMAITGHFWLIPAKIHWEIEKALLKFWDGQVDVEVSGSRLHYEDIWYYRCLGSPIASIVAAISSEALEKPIRIREESYSKGTSKIVLEVLS